MYGTSENSQAWKRGLAYYDESASAISEWVSKLATLVCWRICAVIWKKKEKEKEEKNERDCTLGYLVVGKTSFVFK